MFGIEPYAVEPDIMVMGKGIANGFPLSCFIARDEIADSFKPGDHLTTFGGNPVSCAASLANINFIERDLLLEKVVQKGEKINDVFEKLNPRDAAIGEVRGKGLMIGVEVVKDMKTKEPASKEAARFRSALREKGILIGLGGVFSNVLRIQPPLTISEKELEFVIDTIKGVMEL